MSKYKVGFRVQRDNDDDKVEGGVVVQVVPPKRTDNKNNNYRLSFEEQEKFDPTYLIKWDNGESKEAYDGEFSKEDGDLEIEFREVAKRAGDLIENELTKARESLNQAVELADKHGIPFNGSICFLNNTYTPSSFISKFGDIEPELVEEVTGTYHNEYYGWQHSQVC